jgi:uracil-DNA glycosylase family 4
VSDPQDLLRRYLAQREAAGEGPLFLDSPWVVRQSGEKREAAKMDEVDGEQVRSDEVGRGPTRMDEAKRAAAPPKGPARGKGKAWSDELPEIPGPGIVIPVPSSDLFSTDELGQRDLDGIAELVRECAACRLCENRTQAVPGEGPLEAKLVVVGEGPGAKEDETGRPFVGRAGELLTDILKAIDLPRERVFICNIVKCRPPGNRTPVQEEIDKCVPYLYRQLEIIGPKVILAMGGTAAQTLLHTKQALGPLRNKIHSFRGLPLVVTYHPAALLRNPNWKKPTWDDVRIARQLVGQ